MLPRAPNRRPSRCFVRGYGLVDSTPVRGRSPRREDVTLTAPRGEDAAGSRAGVSGELLVVADGTSAVERLSGKGITERATASGRVKVTRELRTYDSLKSGCELCHQLGHEETRTVDPVPKAKPELHVAPSNRGKARRHGVRAPSEMNSAHDDQGRQRALKMFADWTNGSPRAKCRRLRRRARRASNATSFSRCGTWGDDDT